MRSRGKDPIARASRMQTPPRADDADPHPHQDDIQRQESHNLVWLSLHQIVMRIGWIFKTESVIMPAFLDHIAPGPSAGLLRSLLPLLNRFGQSVPPMFFAARLRSLRRKKWALFSFSLLMAVPFLTLSTIWFSVGGSPPSWLPLTFLVAYALFFCSTGLNNLSFGTLQGKLIRPTRRGRLMALSAFFGAIGAVWFAWSLLRSWAADPVDYGHIFAFTGVSFALAALCALATREPSDPGEAAGSVSGNPLASAWRILRDDANFRKLALVAVLFSTALMMFPHYQALARERLGLQFDHLMVWVIVQNVAAGVFSMLMGPLADTRGTRLAMRLLVFLSALTPVLAVLISRDIAFGRQWFWVVFAPLGMTPITLKTMNNYTLEISQRSEHPRYLSTLSICLAIPFLLSPAVGWLIGAVGFDAVFLGATSVIVLSGLFTFRLVEPRHHVPALQTGATAMDD